MSNELELAGQRALVTGGTKGIGEAVVTRLRGAWREGPHHCAHATGPPRAR